MTAAAKDLGLSVPPPEYRAAFEAQAAGVAEPEETGQRQEHPPLVICEQTPAGQWIAGMHHALCGRKSEKLNDDDRQLAFEDLEVALAGIEEKKSEQGEPFCAIGSRKMANGDDKPKRKKVARAQSWEPARGAAADRAGDRAR